MKKIVILAWVCLMLTGCKVSMDDCYRAIYDFVGPEMVDTFVMQVTQKGVIEDILVQDEERLAWVETEPHMWVAVAIFPEDEHEVGDRVVVSFLVQFRKGGKLDILDKWLE